MTTTFDVQVKIPASAEIKINRPENTGPDDAKDYRGMRIKGRPCLLPENLKVLAKANGVTVVLTEANGDFTAANFSGFNPSITGAQTARLMIQPENITVDVPLYVLDVEPELYFDYGYMRHAGNPNGLPPGASSGYYTVPAGRSLVLSPVVFYMTTDTPSYSWNAGGNLNATQSGPGNKYLKVSPTTPGTYSVSVTVSAGGVTKTASTTRGSASRYCPTLPQPRCWRQLPAASASETSPPDNLPNPARASAGPWAVLAATGY
jgi:hypothetical protein